MGTIGGAFRALSPHSLLRLYLAVVVCAAALAIGAVLWTTSQVDARSQEAASMANAATAAAQVQAGLRDPMLLLLTTAGSFMLSPDGPTGLADADRVRLLSVMTSGFPGDQVNLDNLPAIPVEMSELDAVTLQRSLDLSAAQIDELVAGAGGVELSAVVQQRDRLLQSMQAYFNDDSLSNFAILMTGVLSLGRELNVAGDRLSLEVTEAQSGVNQATSRARLAMLLVLISLTTMMGIATYLVGRLISQAFRFSESERDALRETTRTLQYRNDQLNALYTVFSEITDTLSMRYVVSATLRETLRVMKGNSVVLRLVQDGELVAVGSLTRDGRELQDLPRLPLGDGPTGRVARRGRSMRIDQGAQAMMDPSQHPENLEGVESGIIVPLIVGARVVGTLAVWASDPKAFAEEDERILEMMASQVATAVVAADNAETSERKALRDPLTGLPNRRQLSEDIANHFGAAAGRGRIAVAMMDVDNFKSVNDEYGHRVGDISLQKIATVLRTAMREGDVVYRYGGEEFLAIFQDAIVSDALTAAERLRVAVESTPITGDRLETVSPITISIGVAVMPDHGRDIIQLIEKADRALYHAKTAGRNRVMVWEEEAPESDVGAVA